MRTYTVRHTDAERREISIDFVVHGDQGVAGPWAASVQPGQPAYLMGPSGAYAPDPAADWHLLAGDEAGLPALSAALESLPPNAIGQAFIEVNGPDDEIRAHRSRRCRGAVDLPRWPRRPGAGGARR